MRQERRDAADGAGLAFDIDQRDVALGRGVELQDVRNAKPFLEAVPDVGPQPVAATHPDPVILLMRVRLGMQQVPAQLADVLEQRAVPADDVAPELACRECFADHHRAAAHQNRAGRQHAADAVIHRQAVVHAVARAGVHQPGKPVAPLHHPGMAHVGGFGQPGCAGGVDVERAIVDGHRPALGVVQRVAGVSFDVVVDARKLVVTGAVNPDLRRDRRDPAARRSTDR